MKVSKEDEIDEHINKFIDAAQRMWIEHNVLINAAKDESKMYADLDVLMHESDNLLAEVTKQQIRLNIKS